MTEDVRGSKVVRASAAGARLDSDLMCGGGTDDTQALQRILDQAKDGTPIHLIVDGPALVRGLDVYGGTTIEATAGGGFYLADNADRAVLRNAHRSRDAIVDRGIRIKGCFINGNRTGQVLKCGPFRRQTNGDLFYSDKQEADGTFKAALQFFGVEDVVIEGVTIWHSRAFGAWFANGRKIVIRNVKVDSNLPPWPEGASPQEMAAFLSSIRTHDDGLHFNGPIEHLEIDGFEVRSEDDAIGLNANDMGLDDIAAHNEMGPYIGQGPITDVVIRNVIFRDCLQGIRLLSTNQRIDRVLIENVSGVVRHRTFVASRFIDRTMTSGPGDFGALTFRNIDLTLAWFSNWRAIYPHAYVMFNETLPGTWDIDEEGEVPVFSINARIENLAIVGVLLHAVDDRPAIRVGRNSHVRKMNVSLRLDDPQGRMAPIRIAGGHVDHLDFAALLRDRAAVDDEFRTGHER